MNSQAHLQSKDMSSILNQTANSYSSSQSNRRIKEEIFNTFDSLPKNNAIYEATQQRHKERQTERLNGPLYQKTGVFNPNDKDYKPQIKKTQFSDQSSMVFDMTEQRALKEVQFKPTVIKVNEPGQNSNEVYKPQLKTADLPSRQNLFRNPITHGDPKSEYVVKPTVRKENMPKNQFTWG